MSEVPFNPGDIILGKFRMDRLLGMGNMGVVVAATHLGLNQQVAIKFLLATRASQREVTERFLREARAAVQLQSPHVARVTDVGTTEYGAPYLVMELLQGKDLEDVLEERGPLPFSQAVDYILQASEAIAEAHHRNIVHRDLKPANLFLAEVAGRPCVKVLDFGVAKDMSAAKLTAERQSMGSPYYMSPEQMKDGSSVDPRSDIWALGVVLYQLVTCQHVFDSDTIAGLFAQIFLHPPTPLAKYRTDAPPGFEAAIFGCLQKEREARYQTVAQFAAAIAPFASAEFAGYPARIAAAGRTQVTAPPQLALGAAAYVGPSQAEPISARLAASSSGMAASGAAMSASGGAQLAGGGSAMSASSGAPPAGSGSAMSASGGAQLAGSGSAMSASGGGTMLLSGSSTATSADSLSASREAAFFAAGAALSAGGTMGSAQPPPSSKPATVLGGGFGPGPRPGNSGLVVGIAIGCVVAVVALGGVGLVYMRSMRAGPPPAATSMSTVSTTPSAAPPTSAAPAVGSAPPPVVVNSVAAPTTAGVGEASSASVAPSVAVKPLGKAPRALPRDSLKPVERPAPVPYSPPPGNAFDR